MDSLLQQFAALTDSKGFTTDADAMAPWLVDWRGRYHGRAMAMLAPENAGQLGRIIALANQTSTPVVPQGGNSGMAGGATPDQSGRAILISLRRMNRILSLDAGARQVTAEAGVILQNLHEFAGQHGLRFPLTLGGKGSATIGGLVSTNAGGTQVLRHGTMRALVAGVEAILPDGRCYHGLTPLKKDNRGYDLKHLLIGAEGTLGIVTAATLRLVPDIHDRCVIWAGFDNLAQARSLLLLFEDRAGEALEGFEILPQRCLESVLRHLPDSRAPLNGPHGWHALIEIVRDNQAAREPAELAEMLLGEALEKAFVSDAVISQNEQQAEAFWRLRESISPAEKARSVSVQHDISVPVEHMGDFIESAGAKIRQQFDVDCFAFGHLGDGNVHYHICARDPGVDRKSWVETTGKRASMALHDMVVAANGSISAEHGIGQMKRDELARLDDPVRLDALRAIKNALDPANIMNPGKLIDSVHKFGFGELRIAA